MNLQNVDRLVLGDSLAEGKVIAATAESVTFRLTVPAVGSARAVLVACLRRLDWKLRSRSPC